MLLYPGQIVTRFKKAIFISSILFSCITSQVQAQIKDPSSPDMPIMPTQLPSAQLYEILKDKNGEGKKTTGEDINKTLKEKIEKDSLVKETTPQSMNPTEDTYGMNLFRSGVIASITELSTPPLDYPIGVYDQIIVSMWNGAEATLDYTVA
ncbi:MAG: hypothetical protein WAR78_15910, partial [Ferruginibacter sp.]